LLVLSKSCRGWVAEGAYTSAPGQAHYIEVEGQTVQVVGLHDLQRDPTGFLAELEEAILEEVGAFVVSEGLLDDD
jgi:hypothetical protein